MRQTQIMVVDIKYNNANTQFVNLFLPHDACNVHT